MPAKQNLLLPYRNCSNPHCPGRHVARGNDSPPLQRGMLLCEASHSHADQQKHHPSTIQGISFTLTGTICVARLLRLSNSVTTSHMRWKSSTSL